MRSIVWAHKSDSLLEEAEYLPAAESYIGGGKLVSSGALDKQWSG